MKIYKTCAETTDRLLQRVWKAHREKNSQISVYLTDDIHEEYRNIQCDRNTTFVFQLWIS